MRNFPHSAVSHLRWFLEGYNEWNSFIKETSTWTRRREHSQLMLGWKWIGRTASSPGTTLRTAALIHFIWQPTRWEITTALVGWFRVYFRFGVSLSFFFGFFKNVLKISVTWGLLSLIISHLHSFIKVGQYYPSSLKYHSDHRAIFHNVVQCDNANQTSKLAEPMNDEILMQQRC